MASADRLVLALPKVHLHCHLEGTLRAPTFVELARRDGVSLRYHPHAGEHAAFADADSGVSPEDPYRFSTFQEFLLTFAAVSRALSRVDDYARLAREFVEDARAQNVLYGELFISPSVWRFFHPELDVREAASAIVSELRAADAEYKLIVDLTRNFGIDKAMQTAELAVSLIDLDVIGIGLGGDEARFPPELFCDAFAFARSYGLHCVAHAGEAADASSVRGAIEALGAERIGHGVRAVEDPAVVELLVDRGVALEICPTSNFLTGAADRSRPHPFLELDRAGVAIAIDADDPALFETSITAEYGYVLERAGLETLERFVTSAANATFLPPEQKRELVRRVGAELAAARRTANRNVGT